jgi:hypothetical protein
MEQRHRDFDRWFRDIHKVQAQLLHEFCLGEGWNGRYLFTRDYKKALHLYSCLFCQRRLWVYPSKFTTVANVPHYIRGLGNVPHSTFWCESCTTALGAVTTGTNVKLFGPDVVQ